MKANTKSVSIRLPVVLWRMVKYYCVRHEVTLQQFMVEIISAALRTADVTDRED